MSKASRRTSLASLMIMCAIALIFARPVNATAEGSSEGCQAALTAKPQDYFKIIERFSQQNLLSQDHLRKISEHDLNPLKTGLSASQRKIKESLDKLIQEMTPEQRTAAFQKIQDLIVDRQVYQKATEDARKETRNVLQPHLALGFEFTIRSRQYFSSISFVNEQGKDDLLTAVFSRGQVWLKQNSNQRIWPLDFNGAVQSISLEKNSKGEVYYVYGSAGNSWNTGRFDPSQGPIHLAKIPPLFGAWLLNEVWTSGPGIAFTESGRLRIYGKEDSSLWIYNGETGKELKRWKLEARYSPRMINVITAKAMGENLIVGAQSDSRNRYGNKIEEFLFFEEQSGRSYRSEPIFKIGGISHKSVFSDLVIHKNSFAMVGSLSESPESKDWLAINPTDPASLKTRPESLLRNLIRTDPLGRRLVRFSTKFLDLTVRCGVLNSTSITIEDRLWMFCFSKQKMTAIELDDQFHPIRFFERELPEDFYVRPQVIYESIHRVPVITVHGEKAAYIIQAVETGPIQLFEQPWQRAGKISRFYQRSRGQLAVDLSWVASAKHHVHTIELRSP